MRKFARGHFADTQGILFCVDSTDRSRERIDENNELLSNILRCKWLCDGIPLLILANKQDIDGAMSPKEVEEALDKDKLRGRPWGEWCRVVM